MEVDFNKQVSSSSRESFKKVTGLPQCGRFQHAFNFTDNLSLVYLSLEIRCVFSFLLQNRMNYKPLPNEVRI